MRLATHAAFGACLTLGTAALTGLKVTPASLGLAVLASTLPELDHERSEIGQLFRPLSRRIARKYGHRTLTHSFVALGALGLLASPLLVLGHSEVWWALMLGYFSHMVLDAFTPKGVCWFWPSLTPVGFGEARIKAGSAGEALVLVGSILLSVVIYPIADVGVLGALRWAIGDIDATFREYRRLVGAGVAVKLAGELQENATKRIVRGSWPIVDLTEDGQGYWILVDGALRSVGRGPDRDFYPLRVHVSRGQGPARVRGSSSGAAAGAEVEAAQGPWVPLEFEVRSASSLLVREGQRIEEGQLLGLKAPDSKAETVEELLRSREVRSPVRGIIRRLQVEAKEGGLKVTALVEVLSSEKSGKGVTSVEPLHKVGDPDGEAAVAVAADDGASGKGRRKPRGPPHPPPPSVDGEAAEAPPFEVYFTPGDGPERALLNLLSQARRSIHLALYYFTDDELAKGLADACLRVKCRVLLDEEMRTARYSQAGFLLTQGIEVRFFEDPGIFHHKFLVVDGACVATGSYNWTESAQKRNEENLLILCDRAVAQAYEEEFGRLWGSPQSRP